MTRIVPRTRQLLLCLLTATLVVSGLIGIGPARAEQLDGKGVGSRVAVRSGDAEPGTSKPVTTGFMTVSGSGFGHGVGMSQYGAFGMAKAGASPEQILTHYYRGVQVAAVPDAVPVRVNVVHRGRSVTLSPVATGATGRLTLTTREGAMAELGAGDRAVVTPSGNGLRVSVTRAGASAAPAPLVGSGIGVSWSGPATRVALSSAISGSLTAKQRSYRWGRLWLSDLGGLVEAVATVDLHSQYLHGVAEMPSSWPAAALQTQAIVARSYALVAVAAAPRADCGGCQLWDDQRSQNYVGWAKESERIGTVDYGARWVAAVTATQPGSRSGTAVLYQGRAISAVYSSSTGGRTRAAQNVWGGARPYLTAVADPWSLDRSINPTFAAWNRTVSVPGLLALFDLPDLVSVRVTARDDAGAATRVSARSSSGRQVDVAAETFRRRFGLPSAWLAGVSLNR
jgi:stage II sporulation protein D